MRDSPSDPQPSDLFRTREDRNPRVRIVRSVRIASVVITWRTELGRGSLSFSGRGESNRWSLVDRRPVRLHARACSEIRSGG